MLLYYNRLCQALGMMSLFMKLAMWLLSHAHLLHVDLIIPMSHDMGQT